MLCLTLCLRKVKITFQENREHTRGNGLSVMV